MADAIKVKLIATKHKHIKLVLAHIIED